jgi:hypothetical protein
MLPAYLLPFGARKKYSFRPEEKAHPVAACAPRLWFEILQSELDFCS